MASYLVSTISKHGRILRDLIVEASSADDAERQVPLKKGEVTRDVSRCEDYETNIHPHRDGRYHKR